MAQGSLNHETQARGSSQGMPSLALKLNGHLVGILLGIISQRWGAEQISVPRVEGRVWVLTFQGAPWACFLWRYQLEEAQGISVGPLQADR